MENQLNRQMNQQEESWKSLVELGTKGFFPLFLPAWIEEVFARKSKRPKHKDEARALEVMNRISRHRSLERKKTVLLDMDDGDRDSFIRYFIKMVEGRILDTNPEIH